MAATRSSAVRARIPADLFETCAMLQPFLEDRTRSCPGRVVVSLSYDGEPVWSWASDAAVEGQLDGGLSGLRPRPPPRPDAEQLPDLGLGDDSELRGAELSARRAFRRAVSHYRARELRSAAECAKALQRAADCEASGSAYASLRLERDRLVTELADVRHRIVELFAVNEKCGAKIRELENTCDTLRAQRAEAYKVRDHKEFELAGAQQLCERLQSSNEDLTANNAELQELATKCEARADEATAAVKKVTTERDALLKALEQKVDEVTTLTGQLEGIQRERERLTRDALSQQDKAAKSLSSARAFFIGKGKQRGVPPHLRFTGRIRNLRVEKGQLERIINEVWAAHQSAQGVTFMPVRKELVAGGIAGGQAALLALRAAQPNAAHDSVDYGNVTTAGSGTSFSNFFLSFCQEKWRSHVAEWSYSINDAAERFRFDADVDLFMRILEGGLPETAFADQMVMIQKFKQQLLALDEMRTRNTCAGTAATLVVLASAILEQDFAEEAYLQREPTEAEDLDDGAGPAPQQGPRQRKSLHTIGTVFVGEDGKPVELTHALGYLTVQNVCDILFSFFPAKSQDAQRVLQVALAQDRLERPVARAARGQQGRGGAPSGDSPTDGTGPGRLIFWPAIFAQDRVGNQCQFMECIRDQHVEELALYLAELRDAVNGAETDGFITKQAVRAKVVAVDPTKPEQDWEDWLTKVVGPDEDQPMDTGRCTERLQHVLARRYGPPQAQQSSAPPSRAPSELLEQVVDAALAQAAELPRESTVATTCTEAREQTVTTPPPTHLTHRSSQPSQSQ